MTVCVLLLRSLSEAHGSLVSVVGKRWLKVGEFALMVRQSAQIAVIKSQIVAIARRQPPKPHIFFVTN